MIGAISDKALLIFAVALSSAVGVVSLAATLLGAASHRQASKRARVVMTEGPALAYELSRANERLRSQEMGIQADPEFGHIMEVQQRANELLNEIDNLPISGLSATADAEEELPFLRYTLKRALSEQQAILSDIGLNERSDGDEQ